MDAEQKIAALLPLFRALEHAEGFVRAQLHRELRMQPPFTADDNTIKTLNEVRNALAGAQDVARSLLNG